MLTANCFFLLLLATGDLCSVKELKYRVTTAADENQLVAARTLRSKSGQGMVYEATTPSLMLMLDAPICALSNGTTFLCSLLLGILR